MFVDLHEIRLTCWHEASHAVAAVRLGLEISHATICNSVPEDGTLGHMKYARSTCERMNQPEVQKRILLVALAGPLGESAAEHRTHNLTWQPGWKRSESADIVRARRIVSQLAFSAKERCEILDEAARRTLALLADKATWRAVGDVADVLWRDHWIEQPAILTIIARAVNENEAKQASERGEAGAAGSEVAASR